MKKSQPRNDDATIRRAAEAVVVAWDELSDMELMKDRALAVIAKNDVGRPFRKGAMLLRKLRRINVVAARQAKRTQSQAVLRRTIACVLPAVCMVDLASRCLATTATYTWGGNTSNDWTTATNWVPSTAYPNKGNAGISDFNVVIPAVFSPASAPELDESSSSASVTIDSLTINPFGSLTLFGGVVMYLDGPTITDNGSISVSSRVYTAGGIEHFDTPGLVINGLLTGSGALNLDGCAVEGTFTQDSGHTIQGAGGIEGTITNDGTIIAETPSSTASGISFNGSAATNNGVIKADYGSTVYIYSTTVTQGSGGQIIADGGVVDVDLGATVNGGTISSTHGGLIENVGTDTFNGVKNTGAFEAIASSTVNMSGSSANSGNITVDSTAQFNVLGQATLSVTGHLANNGNILVNSTNDEIHPATLTLTTPITGSGALSVLPLGSVVFAMNAGGSSQTTINITGSGQIDLGNNHFIINYGASPDPVATIRSYLVTGYNGGPWNGPGINSSAANSHYGLGYADGKDGIVSGLSSGQIEIKYTLYGDANLDGVVNGADFTILATNLGKSVSGWDQGDFLYTGTVTGGDFTALVANLGKTASGADVVLPASIYAAVDAFAAANGLMADVPEPATGSVLLIGGGGALMGRRRKQSA
ncbi:MAG: PEP-CTERM sorting domain-containing protein [Tepidisphaeraceae bacterium]